MPWCPVWKRENGDEVLLMHSNFIAEDRETAFNIGMGGSLVEGILLGLKYDRVQEFIEGQDLPHLACKLGVADVIVIAGPTFDAAELPNG